MTTRRIRLPEVSLGPMRIDHMWIKLTPVDARHVACAIGMRVWDAEAYRETGAEITDEIVDDSTVYVEDPATLRAYVHERVRLAVLHEVGEWLRIDRQLVAEPDHDESLDPAQAAALEQPLELGMRVRWYVESPRPGADRGVIVHISKWRLDVLVDDGSRTWIYPDEARRLP